MLHDYDDDDDDDDDDDNAVMKLVLKCFFLSFRRSQRCPRYPESMVFLESNRPSFVFMQRKRITLSSVLLSLQMLL